MRRNIFALDSINFKKKKKNVSTNQNLRIGFDLHELIIFSRKDLRDETFLH